MMGKLRFETAISLDGYTAGPQQSEEHPLGIGGMQLHEWVFDLAAWRGPHGLEGGETNASSAVVEESLANVGATIMGRNMFGGGSGAWGEEPWQGWWGESPPFHHPVLVLTHHAREPLVMQGGTSFFFVTDGIESALAQAQELAGANDVRLGGGANVAQQYLAAGLLDEMQLDVVPILLGGGTRLFENLAGAEVRLEPLAAVEAPGVTHLRYRVLR
jgi:dihydrofolate reductase